MEDQAINFPRCLSSLKHSVTGPQKVNGKVGVSDNVAIMGSGYIGLEFSDVYTALGSQTIVSHLRRLHCESFPTGEPTSPRTRRQAQLSHHAAAVVTVLPGQAVSKPPATTTPSILHPATHAAATATVPGSGSSSMAIRLTILFVVDKTVARIEERISALIFVPKEYGKPLQAKHIGPEEAKQ
ncbi:hypothetical protein RJ639_036899 [Escallonia herrerae]|uniref:Pyridine nucleotide-disulphide oxidoreductase N-terminal domain-containing protein n=1 Tax=Escallonia herrerae TaxID=1293975 RepID=A0AA89B6Y0_9ASTE|nr:hypothetical protein RJ639_036899 [Escallonia herrerae]